MSVMSDLVEFLLVRIAEDEQAARDLGDDGTVGTWSHWVLAECDAKRHVVRLYQAAQAKGASLMMLTEVLCTLALPYADHADYRDQWRV
jgi:uncharacterized protein DUF6221